MVVDQLPPGVWLADLGAYPGSGRSRAGRAHHRQWGTQRLPKMIGTAKALEHMLEGAPLTAQQASNLGLVNAIVPDTELLSHAMHTAARLARRSPVAVRAIKRLAYFTASQQLGTGPDSELAGFLAAGLQPSMKATLAGFTADLADQHDSPLSTGAQRWLNGTRVDQIT